MGSFYKEFPWKKIFTGKSFVKFFPIFKLESDFFPHFLSKIRNNENCENLSIFIFKCAKFQRNQRTFLDRQVGRQVGRQGGRQVGRQGGRQLTINSASVYGTYLRRLTLQVSRVVPTQTINFASFHVSTYQDDLISLIKLVEQEHMFTKKSVVLNL